VDAASPRQQRLSFNPDNYVGDDEAGIGIPGGWPEAAEKPRVWNGGPRVCPRCRLHVVVDRTVCTDCLEQVTAEIRSRETVERCLDLSDE
jgi:hypothetical protein